MVEPMQVDNEVVIAPHHDNSDQQAAAAAADSPEDGGNFLVDNPNIDLEAYASGYQGFMRIKRLLFIAEHAPPLRIDAYRMALGFVKKTLNVAQYQYVHEKLVESLRQANMPSDGVVLDVSWIEQTTKHAETLLEKLDADLKNFKSNAIKESIRRGFDDLGSHYLNMGDLSNALKNYSRVRDYCSSPKNIVNMCVNVIKVCVYLGNWSHVLSYVSKADSSGIVNEKDYSSQQVNTKLKCAAGLANLATGKYKQAAKCFLQTSVDHCDFPELMSASNVTIYGSLCALATFSREELQKELINCSSFKLLLELEPTMREIVLAFYKSHYATCLELLWEIRESSLLDCHLSSHINTLCQKIRFRALVQYFSPYKVADMHKMAAAFKCNVNELEDELMPLILEGQIPARIDSQNKVLHLRQTNQRSLMFAKAFKAGREHLQHGKALVLRNALAQNNIQVQPNEV